MFNACNYVFPIDDNLVNEHVEELWVNKIIRMGSNLVKYAPTGQD